jgi:flagellar FliL protein
MSEAKAESAGAEKKDEAAAAGGGPNKLVLILTGVNVLATIGMIAFMFVTFKKEKTQPQVGDIVADASHGESEGGEKAAGGGEHGAPAAGGEKGAAGAAAGAHGGPSFGKMLTLEQFSVNLSTPGSPNPKFVRVNISIDVGTADVENEVTQKMPQVRNAIIDLFNSKRPGDLSTPEGRDFIKDEIKNALNSFMVTGKVKGVFFTNFVVSS